MGLRAIFSSILIGFYVVSTLKPQRDRRQILLLISGGFKQID